MLPFLLSLVPVIALSSNQGCDGTEYCKLPKIEASKDCPKYGYDCSSTSEMMQFNLSVDRGHSILTCRDKTAKLFVKQTAVEQLECDDGKWSYGCGKTKHALCAKPCNSCSVEVPNYVDIPSVSASMTGATSCEAPCAIAVCDLPGTHLFGVLEKTETAIEIPEKELKCTGKGWTDKAGNKYDHAICGYYNNCGTPNPLTSVTPYSIFGPLQPVNVSHGAVFCPPGYQLAFSDRVKIVKETHYTMYPITCSSSGNWQLLTVTIPVAPLEAACVLECGACDLKTIQSQCRKNDKRCRSAKLESVSYMTPKSAICKISPVCNDINYVPVLTVGSSNVTTVGVCSATAITTPTQDTISAAQCIRYSCKKDFDDIPDINSLACPNRTIASCRRANVHSSRITCPCGWQLVYATSDNPTTPVQTEHLTCAAIESTTYWDSSPSSQMNSPVTVIGASCRRYKIGCLGCAPVKPLFAFHDQVFETPGGTFYNSLSVQTTTGCQQALCLGVLFYNSLDTATHALTCGEDSQWHADDGSVPHTAGCIPKSNSCVPLEAIANDANVDITKDAVTCPPTHSMKYELYGTTVPLGSASAPCAGGRYVFNFTTVIPNNAKVGCS